MQALKRKWHGWAKWVSRSCTHFLLHVVIAKHITTSLEKIQAVHICYFTSSMGQKSGHGFSGFSGQGFIRLQSRCHLDWGSIRDLGGLMLSSLVLAEFFPHDCLAEIPFFLLAIDWGPDGSDSKDSTSKAEDLGSIPGLGRSPGEENPLQKFCLGNPIDRGDWWATVHGVTELVTTEWLSLHFTLQAYSSLLHCSLSRPAHVAGYFFKACRRGTSLVVQWLKLCTPSARGPGLIPCQGTRSHRLWLRVCKPQLMTLHS